MKRLKYLLIIWIMLSFSSSALATNISLKLGPPAIGVGGSNPLSIPPINPIDWELTYLNDNMWEFSASIVPGIGVGKRLFFSNIYGSFGGAVLFSPEGVGLGAYGSIGLDTAHTSKSLLGFVMEYKQSIGFNSFGAIMSYALRFGLSINF